MSVLVYLIKAKKDLFMTESFDFLFLLFKCFLINFDLATEAEMALI